MTPTTYTNLTSMESILQSLPFVSREALQGLKNFTCEAIEKADQVGTATQLRYFMSLRDCIDIELQSRPDPLPEQP